MLDAPELMNLRFINESTIIRSNFLPKYWRPGLGWKYKNNTKQTFYHYGKVLAYN